MPVRVLRVLELKKNATLFYPFSNAKDFDVQTVSMIFNAVQICQTVKIVSKEACEASHVSSDIGQVLRKAMLKDLTVRENQVFISGLIADIENVIVARAPDILASARAGVSERGLVGPTTRPLDYPRAAANGINALLREEAGVRAAKEFGNPLANTLVSRDETLQFGGIYQSERNVDQLIERRLSWNKIPRFLAE